MLARELADVVREFEAWSAKDLAEVNFAWAKGQLARVEPISRAEREKKAPRK